MIGSRYIRSRFVVTLAGVLWLLGCAGKSSPGPGDPCVTPLGGPAWDTATVESQSGYDQELAAISLSSLPATLDTTSLDALSLAVVAYALGVPQSQIQPTLDVTPLAADPTPLQRAVLASFAKDPSFALDYEFLRRGLHSAYACEGQFPLTRDAFKEAYGDYTQYSQHSVANSIPKQTSRILYEETVAGIYVAESVDPASGGFHTEIILENTRTDGALDFLAYDENGFLVDRAPLAITCVMNVLAVPYACALCHRNLTANTFNVVDPS